MTNKPYDKKLSGFQLVLYWIIRTALKILSLIPRRLVARASAQASRLWWAIDRRHREIAINNLALAYPEKSAAWHRYTAKQCFRHFGIMALELPALLNVSRENLDRFVEIEGGEHAERLFQEGRGFFILTAHFGNWELLALAASLFFEQGFNIVVRAMDSPAFDRWLTEFRSRTGNRVIDKDKSAILVQKLVAGNQVVGILLDQNAIWYEGVYVPFFGEVACTSKGLALFALRHHVPVLPVFSIRRPDGTYRIVFQEPLEMVCTGGDLKDDVEANTIRFNEVMEAAIRQAPEQWLWVHRRWRIIEPPDDVKPKLKNYPGP